MWCLSIAWLSPMTIIAMLPKRTGRLTKSSSSACSESQIAAAISRLSRDASPPSSGMPRSAPSLA